MSARLTLTSSLSDSGFSGFGSGFSSVFNSGLASGAGDCAMAGRAAPSRRPRIQAGRRSIMIADYGKAGGVTSVLAPAPVSAHETEVADGETAELIFEHL